MQIKRKNEHAKQSGFTLIETLVALVITVAAAIIVSGSWSGNFVRFRKSTINHNVAMLLERKMSELETKNQGKKILEIKEEEGNFGDEFPQYRWQFKTKQFEMPDLTASLMKDQETVDQMLITVMTKMREALGKSILEGTLTVYVKMAGKEISHSVTTYFIDYDSEIPIGI